MKLIKNGFLVAALVSQPIFACTMDGMEGFVPENNLKISVGAKRVGGITEEQFNKVIDAVENFYRPVIAKAGAKLTVVRKWTDATVNAYAQQSGKEWKVSMFGGLARHATITQDGMSLVVCHEIGHHIGGAPLYSYKSGWAATEGQSDYFATTKCLRQVWIGDDNEAIVAAMEVPEAVKATCGKAWIFNADYNLCIRGAMAGDSVARLFASLEGKQPAKFETPDAKIVTKTQESHPASQCRLDTYFSGALCEASMTEDFTRTSEVVGACHPSLGMTVGNRPLCWFRPAAI